MMRFSEMSKINKKPMLNNYQEIQTKQQIKNLEEKDPYFCSFEETKKEKKKKGI